MNPHPLTVKLLTVIAGILVLQCLISGANFFEMRKFRQLYEMHVEPYIRQESVHAHLTAGGKMVPDDLPKEEGFAPKATPKHLKNLGETE